MIDVEMLGLHPDGNQLILNDSEGRRYALAITTELRDAVKTPSTLTLEHSMIDSNNTANPKNIQAMIRQGKTAEEVARTLGIEVSRVQRYEGPILAEREYAARKAQECRVGNESDAPSLGEMVVNRLAARGVDPMTLKWTAVRHGKGPWEVILTFVQGATEHEAHWQLENGGNTVSAIDDEAVWLSEHRKIGATDEIFDQTVRNLTSEHREDTPRVVELPAIRDPRTDSILDELNSARGQRGISSSFMEEDDEIAEYKAAIRGESLEPEITPDTGENNDYRATVIPMSRHASTEQVSEIRTAEQQTLEKRNRFASIPLPMTGSLPVIQDPTDSEVPTKPVPANRNSYPETEEFAGLPEATLPGMESLEPVAVEEEVKPKSKRKNRQSVPTWDEIVFGAKPR